MDGSLYGAVSSHLFTFGSDVLQVLLMFNATVQYPALRHNQGVL